MTTKLPKRKTNKKKPKTVISTPFDEAVAAFRRMAPQREALEPEEVLKINTAVPAAISMALAAGPRLAVLEAALSTMPNDLNKARRELDDAAMALGHAETQARRVALRRNVVALVNKAEPLRSKLLSVARTLARFGHIEPEQVQNLPSGRSYQALAMDLRHLQETLGAVWKEIKGKTPVTWEMLSEALELHKDLLQALGTEQQYKEETDSDRRRSYTVLKNKYDLLRDAVVFIRRNEGDADQFIPAWYAQRKRPSAAKPQTAANEGGQTAEKAELQDSPAATVVAEVTPSVNTPKRAPELPVAEVKETSPPAPVAEEVKAPAVPAPDAMAPNEAPAPASRPAEVEPLMTSSNDEETEDKIAC